MAKKEKDLAVLNSQENEQNNAITKILQDINKEFGSNTIFELGKQERLDIPTTSSGSLLLDSVLGGGYPVGRIIEVFGEESSGKTSLALLAIAQAQLEGKRCAFIDMEQSLNISYAETLGVDIDKLVFTQPDDGTQALNLVERLIESKMFSLIVVDSVASLITTEQSEKEIGENTMAGIARLMSQAMPKLAPKANKNKCTIIFINQTRTNIGVMYGDNSVTSGGKALRFYATQRLKIFRKAQPIKDSNGDAIGGEVTVTVVKNKITAPYKKAQINMYYDRGIDINEEIINTAVELGIIQKSGSWYSYKETKIGQGLSQVASTLIDNPDLTEELLDKIKNHKKQE